MRRPDNNSAAVENTRSPDITPVEKLLTVEEVAKWLDVTPAWVRAHAHGNRKPKLPSIKLGAHVRFRRAAIQKFLDELDRHWAA